MSKVVVTAGALTGVNSSTRKHTVSWSDTATGSVVSVAVSITNGTTIQNDQQDEAIQEAKRLALDFLDRLDGPITKLPGLTVTF